MGPPRSGRAGSAVDYDQNINDTRRADSLGHSGCIKSSPVERPVSAGSTAKGVEYSQHGSQEAPAIAAWRFSGGSVSPSMWSGPLPTYVIDQLRQRELSKEMAVEPRNYLFSG